MAAILFGSVLEWLGPDLLQNWTIGNPDFKTFGIPMFGIQAPTLVDFFIEMFYILFILAEIADRDLQMFEKEQIF